ncbi:MAG TPA: hypothetical protein VNZ61_18490 [Roseomonas sp.]|nr:hypothetical protein [Roseomonas sp.]
MRRILIGALLLASLAACTYVDQPRPGYGYGYGYGYGAAPAGGYGHGYRDSYEAERQAYEYGRRDGAAGR